MKTTRDLIGLNVFSTEEGRILGRTAECVVDLATGKVLGLVVEGKPGEEKGVARDDITAVGQDAVMVASAAMLKPLAELPALAAHRTAGKTAPQVMTRSGQVLGQLGVVHVDEKVLTVLNYEIVGDLMQAIADGPATVPVMKGVVHGADAIVLPDAAVAEIKRPGGLRARLEKAVGVVRETAADVGKRVSTAAGKAKSATQTASEKALKSAKAAVGTIEDKAEDAVKAVKAQVAKKGKAAKKAAKKAPAKAKAAPKKAAPKKAAPKPAPAKAS